MRKGLILGAALTVVAALALAAGTGYTPFTALKIGGGYGGSGVQGDAAGMTVEANGDVSTDGFLSGVGPVVSGDSVKVMESAGGLYYGIFDVGDLAGNRTYTGGDETGQLVVVPSIGTAGQVIQSDGDGTFSVAAPSASVETLAAIGDVDAYPTQAAGDAILWDGTDSWNEVPFSGDATVAANGAVTVADDSHTHTSTTVSGLDISADTNLSASGAVVLTGDALSHSTGSGYTHVPADGASTQILHYLSAGTAEWMTLGGDATIVDWNLVIAANAVGLGADTTGNYVATVSTSGGISGGAAGSEGTAISLSHTTGSGYTHVPVDGASTQILQYTSAGAAKWITVSGDASVADNGAVTVTGIDISADTNLSAGTGITLTGDALSHSTANGYIHVPANGAANQFLQYSSAGTAAWATLGGDVSLSGGTAAVADDSHAHTTTTVSGLDISADTNLSASGAVVLTGDALSHSTANGYVHIPSGGAAEQILKYSSAGTAAWVTVAKKTIILTAAGGEPTTTAGCAASAKKETTTNKRNYRSLDFDAATDESAFWNVTTIPDDYPNGGTFVVNLKWKAAATGNVCWSIAAVASSHDDVYDAAVGTAVTPTVAVTAVGDEIETTTSAMTAAGSPVAGDSLYVVITRDANNVSDSVAGDVELLGASLDYTPKVN